MRKSMEMLKVSLAGKFFGMAIVVAFGIGASSSLGADNMRCQIDGREKIAPSYVESQVIYCIIIHASDKEIAKSFCQNMVNDLQLANRNQAFEASFDMQNCGIGNALAGCLGSKRYPQNLPITIDQYYYLNTGGAESLCAQSGGKFVKYRRR